MRNEAPPSRLIGKDFKQIREKVFPIFEEKYWGEEPIEAMGIREEITRRGNQRFVIYVYLGEELTPEHQLRLPKTFRGVPVRSEAPVRFVAAGS